MEKSPFSVQERKTPKGKKVFYVQFRGPDGAYLSAKSSGQTSRRAAETWAEAEFRKHEKAAAAAKHAAMREGMAYDPDMPLKAWATLFHGPDCPHVMRRSSEGATFSPHTIRNNLGIINNHILKDPLASRPVASISQADVLAFRDRIVKKNGLRRTSQRVFEVFKTIIREAFLRGLIAQDPMRLAGRIKIESKEKGTLTPTEYRRLIADPKIFEGDLLAAAIFRFVALTGLRRSEALALQWEDIDMGAAVINICRAFKDSNFYEVGLPKWNKKRLVPLAPIALTILREWRPYSPGPLVFAYPNGRRVGSEYWQNSFHRAMDKLGIESERAVTPHSLRHSLNSLLLAGGSAPEAVRAVLGWSDPKVQEGYTHWRLELIKGQADAVQRLTEKAGKAGAKK